MKEQVELYIFGRLQTLAECKHQMSINFVVKSITEEEVKDFIDKLYNTIVGMTNITVSVYTDDEGQVNIVASTLENELV